MDLTSNQIEYMKAESEVYKNIQRLQKAMSVHKQRLDKKPNDYGPVSDLNHVNRVMKDLIKMLEP